MKAPISKKVLAILSDKISSQKLLETAVMVKYDNEDHDIAVGDKRYRLQRINNLVNH